MTHDRQFRKRPVVISAIQWTGDNLSDVMTFVGGRVYIAPMGDNIGIETLEGRMRAELNDWIIRGVAGEFYPCKPAIFVETYDEVKS